MQVKKDEIRLSIIKEAEKEFLSKGFKNASLRKIVKLAGTTIGNFYNYFVSKEILFEELVKEKYSNFLNFIQNHDHSGRQVHLWKTTEIDQRRGVLSEIIQQIIPVFSDRFILLIEGSEGTCFENTKDVILNLLMEHFIEHLQESHADSVDVELAGIIAEQFLNGMLLIMKNYKDEALRKRLLVEHILFYIIGTMGLVEK